MAMELIETIEVGAGGAASIEFTSIPQDGVDLLLVVSGRNSTDWYFELFPNSSTSSMTVKELKGNGSTASSSSLSALEISDGYTGFTSNTFGSSSIYISNYASSNSKSFSADSVSENNATLAQCKLSAASWSDTTAISSLLLDSIGTFQQYSTASLYKIY